MKRFVFSFFSPSRCEAASLLIAFVDLTNPVRGAYTLTDLGPLLELADRNESAPRGINANGEIALTNLAGGGYRAFRVGGSTINLGTLGGGSFASGINDAGSVAGRSLNPSGLTRAFLWTAGGTAGPPTNPQMRDLGVLTGGANSAASAVNNLGQVTGYSETSTRDHAFLWSAGTMRDLGALAGHSYSYGYALNDGGHVVGAAFNASFSVSRAFWHDGTTMRDIGTLGGLSSTALGINDTNRIVGYSAIPDGQEHAFLYDGTMRDIGTLGGGGSYANAINNSGHVVGGSFVDTDDSVYHAFLFEGSILQDLNALVDSTAAGWTLVEALDISEAGKIVGVGELGGSKRGFLLTPPVSSQPGDANRDNKIDLRDLLTVGRFLGQPGATWEHGDFNADGATTRADLALLLANYRSSGAPAMIAAIPEPSGAMLALIAVAAAFALRWKNCRHPNFVALIVGVSAFHLLATPSYAAYRVVDLGPIVDVPDGFDSRPYAVNATGQVAVTNRSGNAVRAYRFDGVMTDLGTLGGTEAAAFGINANGQVVGRSQTTLEQTHAFVWTQGGVNGVAGNPEMQDLGALSPEGRSEAFAINDGGQIVGYSDAPFERQHAFLFSDGTMRDLGGLPGFPNSFAYSINFQGNVAGTLYNPFYTISKGFFYDGNRVHEIPGLGGLFTEALAINDQDRIVGYSQVLQGDDFVDHAFLYDGQMTTDLGTLGGDFSYALGINNENSVVGGAFVDADNEIYHAFVYQNGEMHDLNVLVGGDESDWVFEEARAISNAGHIVGVGTLADDPHGFLLVPTSNLLPGDMDADNDVDRRDAALFAVHFGDASVVGWSAGDFDGDGHATLSDLAALQAHFSVTPLAETNPSAAVPECSTSILSSIALALLMIRRRR